MIVRLKSKPQVRVGNLHVGEKTTTTSIQIVWSPLEDIYENMGVGMSDYKVYWTKLDGKSPWKVLAQSTKYRPELETKHYTSENLGISHYKFMVQAFNSYGMGPNSTVLHAKVDITDMGASALLSATLASLLSICL